MNTSARSRVISSASETDAVLYCSFRRIIHLFSGRCGNRAHPPSANPLASNPVRLQCAQESRFMRFDSFERRATSMTCAPPPGAMESVIHRIARCDRSGTRRYTLRTRPARPDPSSWCGRTCPAADRFAHRCARQSSRAVPGRRLAGRRAVRKPSKNARAEENAGRGMPKSGLPSRLCATTAEVQGAREKLSSSRFSRCGSFSKASLIFPGKPHANDALHRAT